MSLLLFALLAIPYDLIDEPAQALIEAGRDYAGARVCQSIEHSTLWLAARDHARYQAQHKLQGHQNWEQRVRVLHKKIPGYTFREICAESWYWKTDETLYTLGWDMFDSWSHSRGHWKVASEKHDMFGASMALGEDGVWYACIIVGDKQ